VNAASAASASPVIRLVPPLSPSGQVLNVHLAGTLVPVPFQGAETRVWNDCATTGLRLLAP
jgi:hypothetical protein